MRHVLKVLLLVAMLAPTPAFAADRVAAVPTPPAPARSPAAVSTEPTPPPAAPQFFNRDIVTFRAAYFGLQPAERAASGAQRIRDALAKVGPGAVKMVRTAEGLNVIIDGVYVFRILEGDLDADDGQTFDQARVVVSGRLEEAITAARSSVKGRELFRAVGLGATATLALCLATWVLHRARLWLRRRVDARLAQRLHLREPERAALLPLVRALGGFVFVVLVGVLAEEWLRFLFGLFPYTLPWAEHLTGYLVGIVNQVWYAFVAAVPSLVMVTIIVGLARLGSKILRTIAQGIEAGRLRLFGIDADVANPARRLATAALWLAKKLQNPVANLISVPLQSTWDFGIGRTDAMRYTLNVQPVIPFSL